MRAAALIAWSTLLASCMFFRSLDDLSSQHGSGAADEDASGEGGADAGVDAPSDVSSDARGDFDSRALPIDAAILDAPLSGDVTAPPEAGATTPCASDAGHDLCLDFENGTVDTGWTGREDHPLGTTQLVTTRAISLPRSLYFRQPRLAAGSPETINEADFTLLGKWARARVDFDIYVEKPAWQSGDFNKGLAVLELNSDGVRTGTVIFLSESGTVFSVEGAATQYYDGPPLAVDRWAHVRIDVDAAGSVQIDIDGLKSSRSFTPPTHGANPRAWIGLGLYGWNNPAPELKAYYDNVVLDVE